MEFNSSFFADSFLLLTLSLLTGDIFHLLITFANSLDPDQDQQDVGPDLDPKLFDSLIVFLKEIFEKVILKKVSKQHKHVKNDPACKLFNCFEFKYHNFLLNHSSLFALVPLIFFFFLNQLLKNIFQEYLPAGLKFGWASKG